MAGTQCQIETGHNINMTADEIATIQTWEVEARTGGNVFHQIAKALSWQQGWMWTFNLPIQVQQVVDNQHVWAKAIYLCLEYSGTGIVNTLPAEAQRAVNNILETNHPLQQGIQLQHYGSKTRERLRGNPAIMEWVNTTSNFQEFADAFNTYHGSNMDDANMEGDGGSVNRDWGQQGSIGETATPKTTVQKSATGTPSTSSCERHFSHIVFGQHLR